MVLPSGLHNVRLRTVLTAIAVVVVLLTLSNINVNNALLQSQSVFAQEEEETAFLPYNNTIYGIFMQYPSDWVASTSGLEDYADLIAFYSPLQNVSDLSPARLTISVIPFSQDVSLQEYTNSVLTVLNESEQVDLRSSSEVTVADHPGHRVVFAVTPFENATFTLHEMNTWTTIGNKVYILAYEGEESTFNRHLPDVSRMIESLSISSNDETSTTADREVEAGNQTQ
jgi:hypothetical protein